MTLTADRNFILQQGFIAPRSESCPPISSALLFQPRVVGAVVLTGTVAQSPALFAALAVILGWSALLPRWNPFNLAYRHTIGRRLYAARLASAPAPRRFAQAMAGTFAAAIAASLFAERWDVAGVLEALFFVAVAALVLGRFCLGSFVYHLVAGRTAFALRTLPWGLGDL